MNQQVIDLADNKSSRDFWWSRCKLEVRLRMRSMDALLTKCKDAANAGSLKMIV